MSFPPTPWMRWEVTACSCPVQSLAGQDSTTRWATHSFNSEPVASHPSPHATPPLIIRAQSSPSPLPPVMLLLLCVWVCVCLCLSHWVRLSVTRWTRTWFEMLLGWRAALCHWSSYPRGAGSSCRHFSPFFFVFPPFSHKMINIPNPNLFSIIAVLLCVQSSLTFNKICIMDLINAVLTWTVLTKKKTSTHWILLVYCSPPTKNVPLCLTPSFLWHLAVLGLLWKRVQVPKGELCDRVGSSSPGGKLPAPVP